MMIKINNTSGGLIYQGEHDSLVEALHHCSSNCIDLTRADLRGAGLSRADLGWGISLRQVDFTGANLSSANLTGADFGFANLSGANLIGVDLSRANLSGANLSHASLSDANLHKARLHRTCLVEADLYNTRFTRAALSYANLSHANLSHANLSNAVLSVVTLAGVNLEHTILPSSLLTGSAGILQWHSPLGQKRTCYSVKYLDKVMHKLGCFWGDTDAAVAAIRAKYGDNSAYEHLLLANAKAVAEMD